MFLRAAKQRVVRQPRARRVADIMTAAKQVFTESGYEAASISEIAARAGVVEGTIYKFFANKRELLVKVVEHWYTDVISGYEEKLAGIVGTRNRLRYMIWQHLSAIKNEPGICRLQFREIRNGKEYRESEVFRLNRRYTKVTMQIIADGMALGKIRADLPLPLLRDMIFGCVEHHTWNYLNGRGTLDPEGIADAITEFIYRGISVDGREASAEAKEIDRLQRTADRLEKAATRLERAGRTRRRSSRTGGAAGVPGPGSDGP